MICKICGAPVSEGQEYCERCRDRAGASSAETVSGEVVCECRPSSKQGIVGFVLGLASAIPTFAGYILTVLAFSFLASSISGNDVTVEVPVRNALFAVGLVLTVLALGMIVVSIVLGIGAIKSFIRAKRAKMPKPVAGLVMGIIGMAHGAFFAIYNLLMLLLSTMYCILSFAA